MKKKKKKGNEELYQIFFDGEDYCAQTEFGYWRIVVLDSNGETSIEEHNEKPERFKDYELLTFQKIRKRGLYLLCVELYCTHQFLEGADSMSELVDRLNAEAQYVKSLERRGWELLEPIEKSHARYYVPLKPYGLVDSRQHHQSNQKGEKK